MANLDNRPSVDLVKDSNSDELDSHTNATLAAGYTWELNNVQRLRVSVSVWNLFDSDGRLSSPRQ